MVDTTVFGRIKTKEIVPPGQKHNKVPEAFMVVSNVKDQR